MRSNVLLGLSRFFNPGIVSQEKVFVGDLQLADTMGLITEGMPWKTKLRDDGLEAARIYFHPRDPAAYGTIMAMLGLPGVTCLRERKTGCDRGGNPKFFFHAGFPEDGRGWVSMEMQLILVDLASSWGKRKSPGGRISIEVVTDERKFLLHDYHEEMRNRFAEAREIAEGGWVDALDFTTSLLIRQEQRLKGRRAAAAPEIRPVREF